MNSLFPVVVKSVLLLFLSANNPDVLDKLEGLIAQWSRVIEQVLAESEQVYIYIYLLLFVSFPVKGKPYCQRLAPTKMLEAVETDSLLSLFFFFFVFVTKLLPTSNGVILCERDLSLRPSFENVPFLFL